MLNWSCEFGFESDVKFDLEILQQQGVVGSVDVSLAFQTTEQDFTVLIPVLIPTPNLPAATATSSNPALVPPAPTPPIAQDGSGI